tara:strand:+ start:243 stop:578 length:336 start_codon:yes stop_codon:yes gene_type:complete
MKRLSVDDIKTLPDVPEKELEIPEWKVSILLKGMTKSMQVELGKLLDEGLDAFEYQKKLLMTCVVEPKLSEKDIEQLYEKDSSIVDNIFVAINELNGLGGSASADEFPEQS